MANKNPPIAGLIPLKPGQTANPMGNSCQRTRITTKFIRDMADYYDVNGPAVIHEVRLKDPVALLNVIAKLLPKEAHLSISGSVSVDLTGEQRRRIAEAWMMGQSDKLEAIEGEAIRLIESGMNSHIKPGLPDAEAGILSECQEVNETAELDAPPERVPDPPKRLKRGQRAVVSRRKGID
jgi:hypothetical protein